MVLRFTVPGRPVPAVRMTQRGKFVKVAAARYLRYKNEVSWAAKGAKMRAGMDTLEGPVEVIATAYIHGGKSGDVDNLAKSWLDGMNGIIWRDDRQVTDLTIRKRQVATKDEERTEIEVRASRGMAVSVIKGMTYWHVVDDHFRVVEAFATEEAAIKYMHQRGERHGDHADRSDRVHQEHQEKPQLDV